MTIRISSSAMFDEGLRGIDAAAEALAAAEREVSSGRRINAPSDDPIGTASAIAARATADRLDAYTAAADAASSRLTVADSVLNDIVTQLSAAQTTALSGRGSTLSQAQRDAVANQLLAIRDALLSDINTQFQGAYLFSGSQAATAPYVRTGVGISAYQGDSSPTVLDVGAGRTVALSFDGSAIFKGSDPQDVLATLTDLAAAVSSGDDAAIGQGTDALKRAFTRATGAQAAIGTNLDSIGDSRSRLAALKTEATARISKIEDADFAEASARLAQADTAYRAALGAFASVGRLSLMDYLK